MTKPNPTQRTYKTLDDAYRFFNERRFGGKWARNTVTLLSAARGSVLSLCDHTGNMVRPQAQAGFEWVIW